MRTRKIYIFMYLKERDHTRVSTHSNQYIYTFLNHASFGKLQPHQKKNFWNVIHLLNKSQWRTVCLASLISNKNRSICIFDIVVRHPKPSWLVLQHVRFDGWARFMILIFSLIEFINLLFQIGPFNSIIFNQQQSIHSSPIQFSPISNQSFQLQWFLYRAMSHKSVTLSINFQGQMITWNIFYFMFLRKQKKWVDICIIRYRSLYQTNVFTFHNPCEQTDKSASNKRIYFVCGWFQLSNVCEWYTILTWTFIFFNPFLEKSI